MARTSKVLLFYLSSLILGVGKWVLLIYMGYNLYNYSVSSFFALFGFFLGIYIISDIGKIVKGIARDLQKSKE